MLVHPLCCNDDRAGEIGPTFHFMTRHDLVLANDKKALTLMNIQLANVEPGSHSAGRDRKGRRKKKKGNPQFDLRGELFRMTGVGLTQIDGIDVMTVMTVIREAGWDMSKWKTENHFVSWLKLCPDNKISGGKVMGKGRIPPTTAPPLS
jgi:Transposase IS116/IS110/IS902 family